VSRPTFDQRFQEDIVRKACQGFAIFSCSWIKIVAMKEGREENIMKNWTEK
jgi:hypothetical protein